MTGKKVFVTLCAGMALILLSLATDTASAWHLSKAEIKPLTVEGDFLRIELDGKPMGGGTWISPGKNDCVMTYRLTNHSNRTVDATFTPGALHLYLMPEGCLTNDGYINPEKRSWLNGLKREDKLHSFEHLTVFNESEVKYGTGGKGADDWTCSEGSKYLGPGEEREVKFTLPPGGWVACDLTVGLTPQAGNKYQYALFKLGDAEAYATQQQ